METVGELAWQHMPLVRATARAVHGTISRRVAVEDLEGFGIEGLMQAAQRYDGRHAFSTFAQWRIRGAMIDEIRHRARETREPDADELISHVDTVEHQLIDDERRRSVATALAQLPRRERKFIEKIYFEDKQVGKAGAELGVSVTYASRIHTRALKRLRKALKDS